MSTRLDGRGHWPAGRRRNPDKGNWGRLRLQLARMIDDHYERGEISFRALAEALGVDSRSVRRWIDGTHRPAVETQEAIEQWLAEQRERIKRSNN